MLELRHVYCEDNDLQIVFTNIDHTGGRLEWRNRLPSQVWNIMKNNT